MGILIFHHSVIGQFKYKILPYFANFALPKLAQNQKKMKIWIYFFPGSWYHCTESFHVAPYYYHNFTLSVFFSILEDLVTYSGIDNKPHKLAHTIIHIYDIIITNTYSQQPPLHKQNQEYEQALFCYFELQIDWGYWHLVYFCCSNQQNPRSVGCSWL